MKNFLKKLFLNNAGSISWTKVGAWVTSATGAIVVAGVCPPALLPYAKIVLILGGGTTAVGARDAIDKK